MMLGTAKNILFVWFSESARNSVIRFERSHQGTHE